jgi:hypothetical protein
MQELEKYSFQKVVSQPKAENGTVRKQSHTFNFNLLSEGKTGLLFS